MSRTYLGILLAVGLVAGVATLWQLRKDSVKQPLVTEANVGGARATATAGPVLKFNPVVHFDAAEEGQLLVASFPITNRGTADLIIDEFRPACNCAGMGRMIDGKPQRIQALVVPPAQTIEFEMRLHAEGEPGKPSDIHVLARTNDPAQPEIRFTTRIKLYSKKPLAIPQEVGFGRLEVEGDSQVDVTIVDPMRAGKKVIRADHTLGERLSVTWAEAKGENRFGQVVATLRVTAPQAPPGPLEGFIYVFFADEKAPLTIRVTGRRAALAEATPDRLSLPRRTSAGLVWHGTITIRYAGTKGQDPIAVEGVDLPSGVEIETLPGATPAVARIKVTVVPAQLRETGAIDVRLKLKAGAQVAACAVRVVAAP